MSNSTCNVCVTWHSGAAITSMQKIDFHRKEEIGKKSYFVSDKMVVVYKLILKLVMGHFMEHVFTYSTSSNSSYIEVKSTKFEIAFKRILLLT